METIAEGLRFPEGPVAMRDGSVLLVEIERQTLTRVSPTGEVSVVAEVPGGPNGTAIGPDGRAYICNNGGMEWIRDQGTLRAGGTPQSYVSGSIDAVDLASGEVTRLYDRCGDNLLNGPNDIVFDTHGGFYFTDIGKRRGRQQDRGFVYYARPDGSEIREVVSFMATPNGIGLSPDGATLYVAETETGRVWAFEIAGAGVLNKLAWPSPNGGRLLHGFGGYTRLDSLAVTASGAVCVATLEDCSIAEISPDGSKVSHHRFPDMLVTNICFGGKDLRSAFVTLSHTGKLVRVTWPSPGLELNY